MLSPPTGSSASSKGAGFLCSRVLRLNAYLALVVAARSAVLCNGFFELFFFFFFIIPLPVERPQHLAQREEGSRSVRVLRV